MDQQQPAGDRHRLAPESGPVFLALAALTMVSGLVDAASYLGLGRVFTANMTGNVVVLGFAVARTPGFSAGASAVSLVFFLVGAAAGGRLIAAWPDRSRRWLSLALALEVLLTAVAAILVHALGVRAGSVGQYVVIAVLAVAMGCRNAVVLRLGTPDMTTTVLTRTLTGLAADPIVGAGASPRLLRRLTSVALMFAGACVGALLLRWAGPSACLTLGAAATLAVTVFLVVAPAKPVERQAGR